MENIFNELINRTDFWALLGVAFGVVLGEGIRWFKSFRKRKRIYKALLEELKMNIRIAESKKIILQQMIDAIEKAEILDGISVHSARTVYDTNISVLTEYLKPIKRDNLHIIYETLRVIDLFMDNFENSYKTDIELKIMKTPGTAYKAKINDIIYSYERAISLINSFLRKKPIDVFNRKGEELK